jgi:effector-binding domain-containing protein
MLTHPVIVDTAGCKAAVIHLSVPRSEMAAVMPPAVHEILAVISNQGLCPVGPMFAHHLKMSPEMFDFEVGFLVERAVEPEGRVKPGSLPAVKVARTIYQGPYEGLHSAWDAFGKQLQADGTLDQADLKSGETLWESYLVGPEPGSDGSKYRTELNLPLIQS